MRKECLILLSVLSLFLSCKSANNCILDINFHKNVNAPGPDLITFTITSNQEEFENHIEEHGLIEVVFNKKKTFKSPLFGITKLNDNTFELKVASPYFSLVDHYTEKQVYSLFNESKNMIINITLKGKIFVFKKC
tara:strand:+ start:284 stop:688 length:405 start_codon:yes stop_codon:yes gene_type:complete